jgi:hypothetical protein
VWLAQISHIEEFRNAATSPQRRRFTFLAYDSFTVNPTTYVFEITNKEARSTTDTPTFIKGAVLTFIQEGWGML